MLPVLVEEQDRAKQAGKLGFHNTHQALQYFLQRRITRYHLQDTALCITQCLCTPAFGHVNHDTHEFGDIAGRVEDRMTCSVHIFRRTVWKNDPEIRIKIFPRAACTLERLQYPDSVFWMNALYKFF